MSSPPQQSNAAQVSNESKGKEPERSGPEVLEPRSDFRVWNPPADDPVVRSQELPDSYFEPTATELKASYQAQIRAREALSNAPLKTQDIRDREAKSKLSRWPTTTIRIKFPDRTQLEKSFSSTDKIRSVYAFVRNSLREDFKPNKFVLYQTPPRRELKVSDPKVKELSLFELQLAPSSVLQLGFLDEALNDTQLRAPLQDYILAQAKDLPPPPKFNDGPPSGQEDEKSWRNRSTKPSSEGGSKSIPKWLKIGQKK